MKKHRLTYLTLGFALLATPAAQAVGILADPGFEAAGPLPTSGTAVGRWHAFSAAPDMFALSTTNVNSGAQSLELSLTGAAGQFAGVFQEVSVLPGEILTFAGFHAAVNNDPSAIEIRIEWLNGVAEVARTANFVPSPGTSFEAFSLEATAPATADTAKLVYAIQSFGGNTTAVVNVDDLTLVAVPEPSTAALGILGLLGFLGRRRR